MKKSTPQPYQTPTTDAPPPVPPDLDLRAFPYMPLLISRLRDSRLLRRGTDLQVRVSLVSWCVSWSQVPAGSIVNDDFELASLLGYGSDRAGLEKWLRDRAAGALYGWVLHTADGRLYHPTVCDVALETAAKRARGASMGRRSAENRRKINAPSDSVNEPTVEPPAERPSRTDLLNSAPNNEGKGRKGGEGKGREEKKESNHALLSVSSAQQARASIAPLTEEGFQQLRSLWPAARWPAGETGIRNLWTFAAGQASEESVLSQARRYLRSVRHGGDAEPYRWCQTADRWLREKAWEAAAEQWPPAALPLPLPWITGDAAAEAQASLRAAMIGRVVRYNEGPGFWRESWGLLPTAAEVLLAREAWCRHAVAVGERRARLDGELYGDRILTEPEIERARAVLQGYDAVSRGGNGPP